MIPVELAQGRKLAENNVCAVCGGGLVVAWGGKWEISSHVIKCGQGDTHEGFERIRKPTFEELPIHIQNVLKKKWRNKMEDKGAGTNLAKYVGVTSLTELEADEILTTIYKGAPRPAIQQAIWICTQYGLNPLMKHLFLLPFKNNVGTQEQPRYETSYEPVMSIKATRLIASRPSPSRPQGRYSYLDFTPRIMTEEEEEKIVGKVDPENFTFLTWLRNEFGDEAYGVGKWPKKKSVYGADKGNTPENMAGIRSERKAFDKLCPEEMPRTLDGRTVKVMDEEYMLDSLLTGEAIEQLPEEEDIIEGEAKELPPEKVETKCPASKLTKIKTLMGKVSWDGQSQDFQDYLFGRFQCHSTDELSESNADILIASLESRLKDRAAESKATEPGQMI